MSATFHNMRRRLAAQKAKEEEAKQVEKPSEKPKKGKVKKDG